jgi:hypothetical protein
VELQRLSNDQYESYQGKNADGCHGDGDNPSSGERASYDALAGRNDTNLSLRGPRGFAERCACPDVRYAPRDVPLSPEEGDWLAR